MKKLLCSLEENGEIQVFVEPGHPILIDFDFLIESVIEEANSGRSGWGETDERITKDWVTRLRVGAYKLEKFLEG